MQFKTQVNNYSVLILTYNEELNIEECIKSAQGSNDIIVLDSFSTDNTKNIAQKYNIRFYERSFDNYSSQRNYGLHQLFFKNQYVLMLDCDERITPELDIELKKIVNGQNLLSVYLIRRHVFLDNKVLKRNLTSDIWIERLVKPKEVIHHGIVHEKLHYNGKCGYINNKIIHHQFSKGIKNWLLRRSKYKNLEKLEDSKELDLINSKKLKYRILFKKIIQNIPYNHLLYYAYNLFIKLSFLDGKTGLKYIKLETYALYINNKK